MEKIAGANDGDRTRDNRYHKPALYRLSYIRHTAMRSLEKAEAGVQPFLELFYKFFSSDDGHTTRDSNIRA